MKKILVLGGGGFIGSHLVKRFKREGHWVRVVDLKYPEFSKSPADDFIIGDLRLQQICDKAFDVQFDEVYQLAADMGGAGYIFTGEHDADIMHNSALINLNVVERCHKTKVGKVFYSSSACMYPAYNQEDPDNPKCSEESAYPAAPDSEYGWEKLFSERLYLAYAKNHGMKVRIARYHNIFGPEGTWRGGKEKAPAAMCRKVAEANNGSMIEVWGDGQQTRSFLYIDDCVDATIRLMNSDCTVPVNIGSEEMIKINDLAEMAIEISGKNIDIENVKGPVGVRGRNSDNKLFNRMVGSPNYRSLRDGMETTYDWIETQVLNENKKEYCSSAQMDAEDRFRR
jgi:nucleoside-diphosphate-sugar epimerase